MAALHQAAQIAPCGHIPNRHPVERFFTLYSCPSVANLRIKCMCRSTSRALAMCWTCTCRATRLSEQSTEALALSHLRPRQPFTALPHMGRTRSSKQILHQTYPWHASSSVVTDHHACLRRTPISRACLVRLSASWLGVLLLLLWHDLRALFR